MNVEKRLSDLEKAFSSPVRLVVEIVEEGNEILMIKDGVVTHRIAIEEDGGE